MKPRIYADFQNLDDENCVRLDTQGTQRDLDRLGLQLADGLELTFWTDDADEDGRPDNLLVDGVARRAGTPGTWVADVDWGSLRHESDANQAAELNGQPGQSATRAN
jgi:hypothetical protein